MPRSYSPPLTDDERFAAGARVQDANDARRRDGRMSRAAVEWCEPCQMWHHVNPSPCYR